MKKSILFLSIALLFGCQDKQLADPPITTTDSDVVISNQTNNMPETNDTESTNTYTVTSDGAVGEDSITSDDMVSTAPEVLKWNDGAWNNSVWQ